MIRGVDLIKLTIYKLMNDIFSQSNEFSNDFCGYLAGASVNEVFGCHVEESLKNYNENVEIIENGLKELASKYSDLKQPITDSLRVYVQANQMLGSPSMNDVDYVMQLFDKLERVNLFIKGEDRPEPKSFLSMADVVARKYGII